MGFWQNDGLYQYKSVTEYYHSSTFKALVIIPKITGALSIVGSSLIIHDVLRKENREKKLNLTTNRIVFLISVCDVIYSLIAHFLGTWLVPKETGVWSATGNQGTCTFQGFANHFAGGASTALNATLAVTYVLVVHYGWKDNRLHTCFMSFVLLGVPVLASLAFNIFPLINQAFNWRGGWTCIIGPYPYYCQFIEALCVRGTQGQEIEIAFVVWVMVCFAIIFISTVTLFWTVLRKERATDRYAVDANQRNRKQSKRVAKKGIWYAGSFFLAHISWWIVIIREYATHEPLSGDWVLFMSAMFTPLQGLFNAIVYFRPRFDTKNKRNTKDLCSSLCPDSSACCAFGIFRSDNFAKAPNKGTSASNMSHGRVEGPSLAVAANNKMEQCKDEEEKWEDEAAAVLNEEP